MAASTSAYVLDTFALLAYLDGEEGKERVQSVLEDAAVHRRQAYLSLINLGEVLYITERERGLVEARRVLGAVDQLPLQIVGVSRGTVLAAAHIKARFPIAYADAFAVVTAQDYRAVVMTGDPEFEPVVDAGLITVAWLPRRRS